MDYYGNNLGVVIGEGRRPESPSRILRIDKVAGYSRQILDGLQRLHASGIIHRDIKPFNVLLTDQDTVKLCDFGLSKLHGETMPAAPQLKVGSPFYAAPEQEADPEGVEAAADLYAVGVMIYRMLTGRLPRTPLTPASTINPDLDAAWDRFLSHALAPRPADRHPDAAAMADELTDLFARWEDRKATACRLADPPAVAGEPPAAAQRQRPRAHPIRTGPRDPRPTFRLTPLWQPVRYRTRGFQAVPQRDILRDAATGLEWQVGGSAFPMDWDAAQRAIADLNTHRWAGCGDWRLPTVAELLTLLRPPPPDSDECLPPDFATHQKRLWSCDRRTYTSAWYVSLELGFVAWQDRTFACHVKAVRTSIHGVACAGNVRKPAGNASSA
jgi:serine/threonine-protein kinase